VAAGAAVGVGSGPQQAVSSREAMASTASNTFSIFFTGIPPCFVLMILSLD
jgi:MFS superfamily sulfate permease-like transporter